MEFIKTIFQEPAFVKTIAVIVLFGILIKNYASLMGLLPNHFKRLENLIFMKGLNSNNSKINELIDCQIGDYIYKNTTGFFQQKWTDELVGHFLKMKTYISWWEMLKIRQHLKPDNNFMLNEKIILKNKKQSRTLIFSIVFMALLYIFIGLAPILFKAKDILGAILGIGTISLLLFILLLLNLEKRRILLKYRNAYDKVFQ